MAHPFFDPGPFPWLRMDAMALRDQLIITITTQVEIVDVFKRSGGSTGDLNQAQAPNLLWSDVLDLLAKGTNLQALCNTLKSIRRLETNQAFQDAIRAVEQAQPAVEKRWFGDDIVLDRAPLRALITDLQADLSRMNVIIVRGDARSGRSHGRVLFEQAATDKSAEVVYVYAGLVSKVEELIDQLRVPLKGERQDITPRGDTTEDAWHKSVCLDLQALAQKNEQRLWVVVDDLGPDSDGEPLMDSEVKRFCDQFALNMMNPVFRRWFRLLLINYPAGPVPTRWQQVFWSEDITAVADINRTHVSEFLKDWVSQNALISAPDVEQLTTDVMTEADAPPAPGEEPPCRLQVMNERLTKKIKALARAAPP